MTFEPLCDYFFEQCTPARVVATTISSVCLKCGTIAKSGKSSCCARGGSWFKNCGSAGNAKLDHTWSEGIRACKTRSEMERANGQYLNAVHEYGATNSKSVMGDVETSTTLASANISTRMRVTQTTIITSANVHASTTVSDRTCTTMFIFLYIFCITL